MKNVILVSSLLAFALSASAKIELGAPFSDGAVLQRGMKVPVWGKVVPEMNTVPPTVTVAFAGQSKSAVADPVTGRWLVELDPMEASKVSRTLTVTESRGWWIFGSTDDVAEVKDVLVGEVWFASGQSNMECPVWGGNTRYRDRKGAMICAMSNLPCIRYVRCGHRWSVEPVTDAKGDWRTFTAKDLLSHPLSGVAFYYARELYLALDIPIGIVDASWGGTNIDAWTPRCGYEGCDPAIQGTADWKVMPEKDFVPQKGTLVGGPITGFHQQPTVLYNGMVARWAPMAMRGFIWYQGCHNNGQPTTYTAKMHALYNGWSRAFRNPQLKLYFAQLAPYRTNWNKLVAAQNRFVDEQPNAAIAVLADVGNFDDIHPNDKETVGQRLALHALKRDYGFDIAEDDAPVFRSAKFDGGRVEMSFDHVTGWYVYSPDRSREAAFEVAGADGVWKAAKIVNFRQVRDKNGRTGDSDFIDGAKIVVAAAGVAEPVKVRYMGNPRTAGTLYNRASLPLGPFEAAR